MRKTLTAVLATAAFGAAPVAEVRAQTAQDTLGRALEGLQGGQDRRPDQQRGYRDDGRRREDGGSRDADRWVRRADVRRAAEGRRDKAQVRVWRAFT